MFQTVLLVALAASMPLTVPENEPAAPDKAARPAPAPETKPAAAEPPKPDPIPDVKSIEDLRKGHGIALENGWAVRLGFSEAGSEVQPWKLIWCLAEPPDDWKGGGSSDGSVAGDELGPVYVQVERKSDGIKRMAAEQKSTVFASERFDEGLYVRSLPMWRHGEYLVTVRSPKGKVIATREVKIEKDIPCYWHEGVEEAGQNAKPAPRMLYMAEPAFPKYSDYWPIWTKPAGAGRKEKGLADDRPLAQRPLDLPGLVPPPPNRPGPDGRQKSVREGQTERCDMTLSIKEQTLSLKPSVAVDNWVSGYVLARWWVNGKPVLAKATEEQLSRLIRDISRKVTVSDEPIEIALVLPAFLGELKADDKLAVQLLYCLDGTSLLPLWGEVGMQKEARSYGKDQPREPMLSNKLEFPVTEAMRKTRAEAKKKADEDEKKE